MNRKTLRFILIILAFLLLIVGLFTEKGGDSRGWILAGVAVLLYLFARVYLRER